MCRCASRLTGGPMTRASITVLRDRLMPVDRVLDADRLDVVAVPVDEVGYRPGPKVTPTPHDGHELDARWSYCRGPVGEAEAPARPWPVPVGDGGDGRTGTPGACS